MKVSRDLNFTGQFISYAIKYLLDNPLCFLEIGPLRTAFAQERIDFHRDENNKLPMEVSAQSVKNPDIVENTHRHNTESLDPKIAFMRPIGLLGPLMGMDQVYSFRHVLRVLIIGPRTEAEILWYVANGFNRSLIFGFDLNSYSDYVVTGDMHNLPFEDDSFDVIVFSWVLAYSNNQQKAVNEAIRVVKSNGLIGIGEQWDPTPIAQTSEYMLKNKGYSLTCVETRSCNDLLLLFSHTKFSPKFLTEPLDSQKEGRVGWISVIVQICK